MNIFTSSLKRIYKIQISLVILISIFVFSPKIINAQIIETESEEVITPTGFEAPLPDSARALVKAYQEHMLAPNTNPLITNCVNSNFNTGTFVDWLGGWGTWGTYLTPVWYPNEFDTNTVAPFPHGSLQCNPDYGQGCPPLHSIIYAPGTWDPHTGDSLITVFPGESHSTRLGHDVGGSHKSQLKYDIYVDTSKYLFIYRYAVVLEDPGHSPSYQPSFTVQVEDSTGAVIDSTCGYYYIYAHLDPITHEPLPTWHKHNPGPGLIIWKEWTTVGMSLKNYVGHHVSIVFISKDCSKKQHFGYAYLSAFCSYIRIQTSMCEGDTSATLIGPPGFRYLWSTGDTTDTIVVPHPVVGASYSCILTAVNGCQVTIYDTLTYTHIHANFTHGPGCATIPMQFNDSSYVNQNSVAGWNWNFGDGSSPLTGIQSPTHIYSYAGNYTVRLIASSSEGCKDTVFKTIHVDSLPAITNTVLRQQICSHSFTNIQITSTLGNTLYTWTVTSSSPNISGYSANPVFPAPFTNQFLINTGTNVDSVTYTFTPYDNSCPGSPVNFVVLVFSSPLLTNNPLLKSICDSLNTNILLTSNMDSTRFTWICNTNPASSLSGYSDYTILPGALAINQVLYNFGHNIDTVYYHITGHAFGVTGPTYIYRVTVYPFPNLTNNPVNKTICSEDHTNINLNSSVPGTQFTWICNASPGITGWANDSIPTTVLNQQLFNPVDAPGFVIYTISPHANNCDGHLYHYLITVNSLPIVTYTLCHDNITTLNAQQIILTGGIPLGGTYLGAGVFAGKFNPAIAGIGTHTITYDFGNYMGCHQTATQSINVLNNSVFTCGDDLTDVRDNAVYPTIKIGNRCWMAANLNFGSAIGSAAMQRDNCVNEKYCFDDNIFNCASFGGLYQWDEMMRYNDIQQIQGFCPPGWHIPSENDWNSLFLNYTNNGFAGNPLKYSGYSGFNALLPGVMFDAVNWNFSTFATFLWSSTSEAPTKAWAHAMNTINPSVSFYPANRSNAFSIRCLKD
jgi:uncharacterized protein (TIGR02145 family)